MENLNGINGSKLEIFPLIVARIYFILVRQLTSGIDKENLKRRCHLFLQKTLGIEAQYYDIVSALCPGPYIMR